jgi:hypothetical protein
LTPISDGIVEVSLSSSILNTELAARTGDMMFIRPTKPVGYTSPFPVECQCKGVSSNLGYTDPAYPEYLGYPVVSVINSTTIRIIAPNVTATTTATLVDPTDLVFIPAIFNEKNIRTNKKEGPKFDEEFGDGNLYYIIKALGGNLVSIWASNTGNEATDSLLLKEMSVNTDDYVTMGEGFDAANQGTFKLVGSNGRNHIVVYNPNGGKDEIIDYTTLVNGGKGQRIWRVGPINLDNRPIRIVDAESVKIGDRLRISTPSVVTATWFPASMYGSWRITGIGYVGITQATGSMTACAADPTTGIKGGDTIVMGDGNQVLTFEFSTSGSVSNQYHVKIDITPMMSANEVAIAICNAINGLGNTFSISASYSGPSISLVNRRVDGTRDFNNNNQQNSVNYTILETLSNGATLSPVGMSGALISDSAITPYIDIEVPNAVADLIDPDTGLPLDKFQIAGNASSIGFIEQTAFSGYRLVGGHCVNPQNAEESEIFLMPKILTSKMSDTFGTKITGLFKIGFEQRAFQGIDGYKVYAGLVREAHRVIDGLPTNTILYPGTKAMGAPVEVLPPLVKTVQISLQVRPKDGVTINSISEIIKSTVAGYINKLGVGKPVVISEIIRVVQGLPGVYSVTVTDTTPAVTDDRIVVGDMEVILVLNADSDITVG